MLARVDLEPFQDIEDVIASGASIIRCQRGCFPDVASLRAVPFGIFIIFQNCILQLPPRLKAADS